MGLLFIQQSNSGNPSASRDGRHNRNTITVLYRRGFLLQIANVLVVKVDVDEGAQLAVIGIKMTAQVRMLGDQVGKGSADGAGLDLNGRLFASVLAQGRRNLDLGIGYTTVMRLPQEGLGDSASGRPTSTDKSHSTSIFSSTSFFVVLAHLPVSSKALVSMALPFSTLVIT